jgi:hypothetical protein
MTSLLQKVEHLCKQGWPTDKMADELCEDIATIQTYRAYLARRGRIPRNYERRKGGRKAVVKSRILELALKGLKLPQIVERVGCSTGTAATILCWLRKEYPQIGYTRTPRKRKQNNGTGDEHA